MDFFKSCFIIQDVYFQKEKKIFACLFNRLSNSVLLIKHQKDLLNLTVEQFPVLFCLSNLIVANRENYCKCSLVLVPVESLKRDPPIISLIYNFSLRLPFQREFEGNEMVLQTIQLNRLQSFLTIFLSNLDYRIPIKSNQIGFSNCALLQNENLQTKITIYSFF